jgi:peptide/nickel transport system substrate-binding protein
LAVAALSLLSGLTACAGATDPAGGEPETTTAPPQWATSLTWGVETEPVTFTPFVNSQDAATPILRNLYDSYLFLDADGQYQPWLAESYEVSGDGLTIQVTIRDGITFSDGEPLDADAAVLNLTKTQDPAIVESTTWAVNLDHAEKVDDRTFALILKTPDVRLLERLSSISGSPISPKDFDLEVNALKAGTGVHGTGPFRVEEYVQGERIELAARPEYNWAPEVLTGRNGPAATAAVTYRFLGEASTRTGALSSGQVDAIDSVPSQDVPIFTDDPAFAYEIEQNAGTPYTLYFNVSRPPFDDVRVRQAIQKSVNLDEIVGAVYNGTAQAAKSPISPHTPFYDQSIESYLTQDKELANQLLDEAGYTGRDVDGYRTNAAGERLSLHLFSNSRFVRDSRDILNQAIAGAVKDSLSVDYTWESVDSGTWTERRTDNDYVAWDNSLNSGDVASALAVQYHSDPAVGFINLGQIHDPKVDALVQQGQESFDLDVRRTAYLEFQNYVLTEQAYVLPLYVLRNSHASATTVSGFLFDPATGNNWSSYNLQKQV